MASAIPEVGVQSAAGAGSADGIADDAACGSGEVSPEAGCEDAGLSVEVWDGAVIPNYVICFLNFFNQVELSGDYLHGDARCKPTLARETEKLRVAVAGDDDDAVKFSLRACLVQEGNINQHPFATGTRGFGERGPALADDGMKDGFESLALAFIAEDERTQFRAVGPARVITGFMPECRHDGIAHRIVRGEQVMHATVGVKMRHR